MRFIIFDFRRPSKIVISIIIILLGISYFFLNFGYKRYEEYIKSCCNEFQKVENIRLNKSIESMNKGLKGLYIFRFLVKPSPLIIIFHNAAAFDTLQNTIDNTGVIIENNSPINIEHLNSKHSSIFDIDLSRFILLISFLIVPIFGFYSYRDTNIEKFKLNYIGHKISWIYPLLSRAIYIVIFMTALTLMILIYFKIHTINLDSYEIAHIFTFAGTSVILMIITLTISSIIGMPHTTHKKKIITITICVFFLFIMPGLIKEFSIASLNNSQNLDAKKFELYNNYQQFCLAEASKSTNLAQLKDKLYRRYLEKELKAMKSLENSAIKQASEVINDIHFRNTFIPTSFFSSLSCELSSMGYYTYLNSYKKNNVKQEHIVNYYLQKKPAISEENIKSIFQAHSSLPEYFPIGILMILFYLTISLFYCFREYKKSIFPHINHNFEINLKNRDRIFIKQDKSEIFSNKLFNYFFRKDDFNCEILLNNKNIAHTDIFYFPNIPIKVRDLLYITGKKTDKNILDMNVNELDFENLQKIIPEISRCKILLLDNIDNQIDFSDSDIAILEVNQKLLQRTNYLFYTCFYESGNCYLKPL